MAKLRIGSKHDRNLPRGAGRASRCDCDLIRSVPNQRRAFVDSEQTQVMIDNIAFQVPIGTCSPLGKNLEPQLLVWSAEMVLPYRSFSQI
jgi:hypothetical protein